MKSNHFQPAFSKEVSGDFFVPSENPYSAQEMGSRLADAHQHITYPGEAVDQHIHPFHEIIYCITGSASYTLEGTVYQVGKGDIFFVPAGVAHSPVLPETLAEPYRRYSLWFSQEFAQPILAMLLNGKDIPFSSIGVLHTTGTPWEGIGEHFRRCVQECEQRQSRWEAAVFGIAVELSVHFSRLIQGVHRQEEKERSDLMGRILEYVESHLADKLTAADMAARFWVSESTVRQLFRRETGVPFHQYVNRRRLAEAQVLIRSGVPMEQVSISVGFQDYSAFYRAFKAEFGISPSQFRRQ